MVGSLNNQVNVCGKCGLVSRPKVVVGRGNPRASLMLIGEAPGAQEDVLGIPFVGRSGKLLDNLIERAGLCSYKDFYFCNVVKCRPPNNRRPNKAELVASFPWLIQQIRLVDPLVIVLSGSTAVEAILGIKGGITKMRGTWREWQGRWIMPLLHPSYLLRNPSKADTAPTAMTVRDLKEVRNKLYKSHCR